MLDCDARSIVLGGVLGNLKTSHAGFKAASPSRARGHFAQHCNKEIQENADENNLEEAESWMQKTVASGLEPTIESLKALLRAWTRHGMLTKAEEWFTKVASPALHPEFSMLELDATCYNTMAQAFAENGDAIRSERYAADMKTLGFAISQRCYTALVRCCLQNNDARRAHCWCKEMIEDAGFKKPNKAMMIMLIRMLADSGNTTSANKWLGYMSDMHLKVDQETYEHVRRVHPVTIIPSQLSGEVSQPIPPGVQPVLLKGEHDKRRDAREKIWAGPRHTPRRHLAPLSARPRLRPLEMPTQTPPRQLRTAPARPPGQLPPMSEEELRPQTTPAQAGRIEIDR